MESKYYCEKCCFRTNFLSHWEQHTESKKHNGEKRKERCDKFLEPKCKFCNYETNKTTNMKQHYLNKHGSKEERQKEFLFYCDNCDFGCFIKLLFDRHLESIKHQNSQKILDP